MDPTLGVIARYQRNYAEAMPHLRVSATRADLEWLRVVAQTAEGFAAGTHVTERGATGGGQCVPPELMAALSAQRDLETQFQKQESAFIGSRSSLGLGGAAGGGLRRQASGVGVSGMQQPSHTWGRTAPADSPRGRPSPRGQTVVTNSTPQSPEEHAAELRRERREVENEERRQRMLYSGVWLDQWHGISRDCRAGATRLNVPITTKSSFGHAGHNMGNSGSAKGPPPQQSRSAAPERSPRAESPRGRPGSARMRPSASDQSSRPAPTGDAATAAGPSAPQTQQDLGRRWVHDFASKQPAVQRPGQLPPVRR